MQARELPAPARVRGLFEEVLAHEDFQYAEGAPWVRWLRAFMDFLGDLLRRWWPDLADSEIRLIAWMGLGISIVITLLSIYRWASGRQQRPRPAVARAEAEPRNAQGWAALARADAAAGRYRRAATGLYQATILNLDAAGSLRYRDWKTPGDYAAEISGGESLRTGFVAFLRAFVELAFGPREPDAESFEALSARASSLGRGASG